MTYRWGDPRERYDPEADVGLPRPFWLAGENQTKPKTTHGWKRPEDPAKANPKQPLRLPTFVNLADLRKRTGRVTNRKGELFVLSKDFIKKYEKGYYITYVKTLVGGMVIEVPVKHAIDRIKGDNRPGVFAAYYEGGHLYWKRAPSAMQGARMWDPNRPDSVRAYATFTWQWARREYWEFSRAYDKWREETERQAREQYESYSRGYDKWLREQRRRLRRAVLPPK